jgi:hypothetical protein
VNELDTQPRQKQEFRLTQLCLYVQVYQIPAVGAILRRARILRQLLFV